MQSHPITACLLNDNKFKCAAVNALKGIDNYFHHKILCIKKQYDQQAMSNEELEIAKKRILIEAILILYPVPAENPAAALKKLTFAADFIAKERFF